MKTSFVIASCLGLAVVTACSKGAGGGGTVNVVIADTSQSEFAGAYGNALATASQGDDGVVSLFLFKDCPAITCDKVRDEYHFISAESVDKAVAKECPAGADLTANFMPKTPTFKSTVNMSKGAKSAAVYADGSRKPVTADSVEVTISASTQSAAAGSKSSALGTVTAKLCPMLK